MSDHKKILGKDRRKLIIQWLKESSKPITGNELAKRTNVSRQVIVQDVSLLKASQEPIIATNRGYMYVKEKQSKDYYRQVIVCRHRPEDTKKELNMIVDCGVTVRDVVVEHPFYGDLTGSLMISSRYDVEQFLDKISKTDASLLSELTDGIHLHTLEADSVEKIEAACQLLAEANYLFVDEK